MRRIVLALLLASSAAGACGKKGPPLPPLSTLPRAPEAMTARLQGDQVQIRFRVPRATQSNVEPANLQRVDVYALTGPLVDRQEFIEEATLVGSVPIRRPSVEGETEDVPSAAGDEDALEQGALAVFVETLTPEAYDPITLDAKKKKEEPRRRRRDGPIVVRRTPLSPPDLGTPVEQPPMRHYVAVGVTRGGRKGLPSVVASVSLDPPPPAAPSPIATVQEGAAVALTWEPPPGLRSPIQRTTLAAPAAARQGRVGPGAARGGGASAEDPEVFGRPDDGNFGGSDEEALPDADDEPGNVEDEVPLGDEAAAEGEEPPALEPAPAEGDGEGEPAFLRARPLLPWPSVASGYHVYAVPAEPPKERASPYSADALPELLTPRPVEKPEFTDKKATFGDERCYVIRVAEVSGTALREGPPSQPTCLKVTDVFPPDAPGSLEAVASDGAVNLIWEANREPDLAGYLVIRSEGVDARPQQLTPKPLAETTFRDTKVKAGVRYVYVVVAVDKADPANRSAPSNAVEVTAR